MWIKQIDKKITEGEKDDWSYRKCTNKFLKNVKRKGRVGNGSKNNNNNNIREKTGSNQINTNGNGILEVRNGDEIYRGNESINGYSGNLCNTSKKF